MKVFALWTLFACVNSETGHRSVNLALNTAVSINENEAPSKIAMIEGIQKFLDDVKSVLTDLTGVNVKPENLPGTIISSSIESSEEAVKAGKHTYFTAFVDDFLTSLLEFRLIVLKQFANIFNEEARKFNYKDCRFSEIIQDPGMRKAISKFFDGFTTMSPENFKYYISLYRDMLRMRHAFGNKKGSMNKLLDYLNTLYDTNDAFYMTDLVDEIVDDEKKGKSNLRRYTKEGLRRLFFDKYSKQDYQVRHKISRELEKIGRTAINVIEFGEYRANDKLSNATGFNFRAFETTSERTIKNNKTSSTTKSVKITETKRRSRINETKPPRLVNDVGETENKILIAEKKEIENQIESESETGKRPQEEWSNISTRKLKNIREPVNSTVGRDSNYEANNKKNDYILSRADDLVVTEGVATRIIRLNDLMRNQSESEVKGYKVRAKDEQNGTYYEIVIDPAKCKDNKTSDVLVIH